MLHGGIFVTGTDTGVGKTVVTAALCKVMTAVKIRAVPFKPVQTGAPLTEGGFFREDLAFYRRNLEIDLPDDWLSPVCYEAPLAPAVAAALSDQPVDLDVLDQFLWRLANRCDMVLVEGAGGLAVPLTTPDFTMADLACRWRLPLLIVGRAGLGTINHTVLTVRYAREKGIPLLGIILNGASVTPDLAEQTSPEMIRRMTGIPILARLPHMGDISQAGLFAEYCRLLAAQLDIHKLTEEAARHAIDRP
ncbi:dethiobiotin synthetase [Heliomicrobium modesticaldum Ice1]|uniref:ATP-dependent dethiobiotin synthetase BioD n=1 Tax=Heliobacterium modesticaldum (strain ATCC 51547 / Ice1) TaxID=498761 RepID=B0TF30_HELMI|nr:dethiobiotin synthase [Heliomicrobium modesticaldum]ABZ83013.1 dethiobiotin synthetase [Heliomicrobium modesticaldum Ice1]